MPPSFYLHLLYYSLYKNYNIYFAGNPCARSNPFPITSIFISQLSSALLCIFLLILSQPNLFYPCPILIIKLIYVIFLVYPHILNQRRYLQMNLNTNKTNFQALEQLINEYPELPVIPLILDSFVEYYNLYTDYTIGCIGTSFISKYCYYNLGGEKLLITYEDIDLIEDYLSRHDVQDIEAELNNIKWIPAIFFHLVTPQ